MIRSTDEAKGMAPTIRNRILSARARFVLGALRRTVSAWMLALWALLAATWRATGSYDLALSELMPPERASKFPRAYQAVTMFSGWLSTWEFWTVGGLLLAFGAAVEHGVRAERRGERNAEAKRAPASVRPAIPPDAPIAVLADKVFRFLDALEKGLTTSPKPRPPRQLPPPDPEPDWDVLYGISEDGEGVRLRFLPDGDDVEGHALLLVLHGYKVRLGRDRIPVQTAAAAVLKAMREAPNASLTARMDPVRGMSRQFEPERVGAQAIVRGEVERIGLSTGGHYTITGFGLMRADEIARDLIRRA